MQNQKKQQLKIFGTGCLVSAIIFSLIFAVYAQTAVTPLSLFGGIYPRATTYTVFREGSNYFAKDAWGTLTTSNTNFTSLVNAVTSTSSQGTIYFKAGTYSLTGTLYGKRGWYFEGEGSTGKFPEVIHAPVTLFQWNGGSRAMFSTWLASAWFGGIKNVVFDGNNLATIGLELTTSQGSLFENVRIYNATNQGILLRTLGNITGTNAFNTFIDVTSTDANIGIEFNGYELGREVTLNNFYNSRFHGDQIAVRFYQYADTNSFFGGRIEADASGYGIIFGEADYIGANQNYFMGTAIDSLDASSIGVLARIDVTKNYLDKVAFGGTFATKIVNATYVYIRDSPTYLNEKILLSGTFAIDSTGAKEVVVAHGLGFTPAIEDIQVTVNRNTAVDDWGYRFVRVNYVDSTNISVSIYVDTASGTGGATAKLSILVYAH